MLWMRSPKKPSDGNIISGTDDFGFGCDACDDDYYNNLFEEARAEAALNAHYDAIARDPDQDTDEGENYKKSRLPDGSIRREYCGVSKDFALD